MSLQRVFVDDGHDARQARHLPIVAPPGGALGVAAAICMPGVQAA
jgi:hypothetical protein